MRSGCGARLRARSAASYTRAKSTGAPHVVCAARWRRRARARARRRAPCRAASQQLRESRGGALPGALRARRKTAQRTTRPRPARHAWKSMPRLRPRVLRPFPARLRTLCWHPAPIMPACDAGPCEGRSRLQDLSCMTDYPRGNRWCAQPRSRAQRSRSTRSLRAGTRSNAPFLARELALSLSLLSAPSLPRALWQHAQQVNVHECQHDCTFFSSIDRRRGVVVKSLDLRMQAA